MALTVLNLDSTLMTTDDNLSDRLRDAIGSDEQFALSLTLIADGLSDGIIDRTTAEVYIAIVGKLALALDEC